VKPAAAALILLVPLLASGKQTLGRPQPRKPIVCLQMKPPLALPDLVSSGKGIQRNTVL